MIAAALLAACAAGPALAQATDAYHAYQVFPVVVDTSSFTQRFTFRNPFPDDLPAEVVFYPEATTAQAAQGTPLACPTLSIPPNAVLVRDSLRTLCPGLVSGSAFGTLVLRSPYAAGFAAYSRVSNAAGIGFSVEAFAAHEFTRAQSVVTGLRRKAATATQPAFQSNCFVGNLGKSGPSPTLANVPVDVALRRADDTLVSQGTVSVAPGGLLRLLDVFGATGAPAGDYDDVSAVFTPSPTAGDGIVAFCTVQDNTSFGADFRIAKQERWGYVGPASDVAARRTFSYRNPSAPEEADISQVFSIPPGATRNVHVLYLRHPDRLSCILAAGTFSGGGPGVASLTYGLEMRLLAADADGYWSQVVAGGNNATSWFNLYLGDKADRAYGIDTRYLLEVESNGWDDLHNRPYTLQCTSGSGHTFAERIGTGLPEKF